MVKARPDESVDSMLKRFKRDVATTIFTANLEAINSLKLQMRIIDGQIQREWGAGGNIS